MVFSYIHTYIRRRAAGSTSTGVGGCSHCSHPHVALLPQTSRHASARATKNALSTRGATEPRIAGAMLVSLRRAQGGGGLEYCRGKSRRVAQNRGNVSLYLYISLQHLQKSPKISTRFSDDSHNGALRKQDLAGLVPFLSDLLSDMYMHYIVHYSALHSALHQRAWCGFLMPPFLNAYV